MQYNVQWWLHTSISIGQHQTMWTKVIAPILVGAPIPINVLPSYIHLIKCNWILHFVGIGALTRIGAITLPLSSSLRFGVLCVVVAWQCNNMGEHFHWKLELKGIRGMMASRMKKSKVDRAKTVPLPNLSPMTSPIVNTFEFWIRHWQPNQPMIPLAYFGILKVTVLLHLCDPLSPCAFSTSKIHKIFTEDP
jgi:hypothetical protein